MVQKFSHKIICSGVGGTLLNSIYEQIATILNGDELFTVAIDDDESAGYPVTIKYNSLTPMGSTYVIKYIEENVLGIRVTASNGITYWDGYNITTYMNNTTGERYFVLDFLPLLCGGIFGVYVPSADDEVLSNHGLAADIAITSGGSVFLNYVSGTLPTTYNADCVYLIDSTDVQIFARPLDDTSLNTQNDNNRTIQYEYSNESVQLISAYDGTKTIPVIKVTRVGPVPRKNRNKNNLMIANFENDIVYYLTPLTNKNVSALGVAAYCHFNFAFEARYDVNDQTSDDNTDPYIDPDYPTPEPEPDSESESESEEEVTP